MFKIIIAPAMNMKTEDLGLDATSSPIFLEKAKFLLDFMKNLSFEDLQKLWNTSEKLTNEYYDLTNRFCLDDAIYPAVLAYDGIAYKYLKASIMTKSEIDYINQNLYIYSALYGVLRPFDAIIPYRLEMKNKLNINAKKNLYDFWADSIYKETSKDSDFILNLASEEYALCARKYAKKDEIIDVVFGEMKNGKTKSLSVHAKMARGSLVRFLAENKITKIDDIKEFDLLDFKFSKNLSDKNKYVFLHKN